MDQNTMTLLTLFIGVTALAVIIQMGILIGMFLSLKKTSARVEALVEVARNLQPHLTIVGPEVPLANGVVDEFHTRGWRIFGPTRAAARLESSKSFAKEFMQRFHIPTAHYAICQSEEEVKDALAHFHPPIVVKADGLAAGKGVVLAESREQAASVAGQMLAGSLVGAAGASVVLEEFLEGEELSFIVLTDGQTVLPLASTRDHKRLEDGDKGPNTGGMGAYSDGRLVDAGLRERILREIVAPTLKGLASEARPYQGFLYFGLMLTAEGPRVLEFNCRMGDPECQPLVVRLESDLAEALERAATGRLAGVELEWSRDAAVCVVLASAGYPRSAESGKAIQGLEAAAGVEGVVVFHAGTRRASGGFETAGGRVLGVTARGASLGAAVERAYAAVGKIHFDGMHYRKDIAARGM